MPPPEKLLKTPAGEPRPRGRPRDDVFGKRVLATIPDRSEKRVRVDDAADAPGEDDANSLGMAQAITELHG